MAQACVETKNMTSSLKTIRVSDKKISVPRVKDDVEMIKGGDWLPTKYANCFACSLKGSGKTTVLTNLLWHMIGPDTKVIIISPTVELDKTWINCKDKLEKKGYSVQTFNSINDVDNGVRFNVIREFLDENKYVDEPKTQNQPIAVPIRSLNIDPFEKPKQPQPQPQPKEPKKMKKISPAYIIIIDDCGAECRDKNLEQLMKTNRHYKTLVLISSQSLHDLTPNQIRQLQYVFLFARFSYDKLESLYKSLDLSIDFDKFLELYHDATNKKYGFLYIGREPDGDEYRKGFTDKYIV